MIEGWYYLHTNNDLIYKKELGDTAANIRESDFAVALWPLDPTDREGAWSIIVESLAAGANPDRVQELAEKWGCTERDAAIYSDRIGFNLSLDGDKWCATALSFKNLQESPAGFGGKCYEAMADLAKTLGYRPSKMWGATFKDLVSREAA